MTIKWETPPLKAKKPNREWAQNLLDRVERGDWDYKKNGHAPIAIAEAALRNEAV